MERPHSDVNVEDLNLKDKSFKELGLKTRLLRALDEKSIEKATPIQRVAIPLILAGVDIVLKAKTGSGKTFAYLLPMLHKLFSDPRSNNKLAPTAFVLVPTREICHQVYTELTSLIELCRDPLKVSQLTSTMSSSDLETALSGPPDILVSTPDCIHSCLSSGSLQPGAIHESLSMLVLDEADLLLSYGYEKNIRALKTHVSRRCQCLLMSATSSADVEKLKELVLHNPYSFILPLPKHGQWNMNIGSERIFRDSWRLNDFGNVSRIFTLAIRRAPLPREYWPPQLDNYDGKVDPVQHLTRFNMVVNLYGFDDATLCKVFLTTLRGLAINWYTSMRSKSIRAFKELCQYFISAFMSQIAIEKVSDYFMSTSQEREESPRDFRKIVVGFKRETDIKDVYRVFTSAIRRVPPPRNYQPPELDTYDGTGDPIKHVVVFNLAVGLYSYDDATLCKVFITTLMGVSNNWYFSLRSNSIGTFRELCQQFISRFMFLIAFKKNERRLMNIRQEEGESLRDLWKRFSDEMIEITNLHEELAMAALENAITDEKLIYDINKDRPHDFTDLLYRVRTAIAVEDHLQRFATSSKRSREEDSDFSSGHLGPKRRNRGTWRRKGRRRGRNQR